MSGYEIDPVMRESQARWAYFKCLRNAYTAVYVDNRKKTLKTRMILSPVSIIVVMTALYGVVQLMNLKENAGSFFLLGMVAFLVYLIYVLMCVEEWIGLGDADESSIKKLDIALKSSETVRSIMRNSEFKKQVKITDELAKELYRIAEGEASGEYLKVYSEMEKGKD